VSSPDLRLVRRVIAGEEAAFAEFFEGYFSPLYRFAMARMNHDADAAEEVVQATFCKAIPKLGTYRGEASLLTWLCTLCRHEISGYYRRQGSARREVELIEDQPEIAAALQSLAAASAAGPEGSLLAGEIARLVHVALDQLPLRYAHALEWKYAEGMSVQEIAVRLGLTPKAAESLLTRAREAFREGFAALTRGPDLKRNGPIESS
jgi:RNA polymerase sigma-70 factor (ECF subfamily)